MKILRTTIILATLLMALISYAQINSNKNKQETMKTFIIEREIPNAGELTQEQLRGISQKSNQVLSEMGTEIEWLHSYVANQKVYCLYKAKNEELILEHAEKGGFPANSISEVENEIGPKTAKD
ncbi:DUF4242 domain-containing protein [uncultured Allomuricauda sp.]|uniref:DUF4242 domain-containing protein n=1 Tax=Flagellimonas sp. W118 TaxID=3410791 RepID=UPI00261FB9B7|nr:DUF4242 domain-containing protein [uncultured Allomuricauda sp.]